MDRNPRAATGPFPPKRAVSGGNGSYGGQTLPKPPPLPSRLSQMRSVSQPVDVVDLTRAEGRGRESGRVMAEEVVKSPEVMEVDEDDIEPPPAKRAKTAGDDFKAEQGEEEAQETKMDVAHESIPGTALPALPKARPSAAAGKMSAYRRHRFGIEPSARQAHGLSPPTAATRVPPPKRVLDFSPWTGNHREDEMSENAIKTGYFDKLAGTSQAETNGAKGSVWPGLSAKNSAGLSALSYMFVAVMEKRVQLGRCTAPSTFKPPPRLAVQEAKRAKWLEDLADPSVSLRRLSKTIPHGIKGKLLLEQCLSRSIPLHRALWLVRGVGMHELRAFRRKGFNEAQAAQGEVKWVGEWTINVTQFLEDVVAACGQEGWKKKMNYALKLAAALYVEKLLDLDYYLDWIVSSLAEATMERLPIWTIIVQIHWKALTAHGRRGRRLAEALLEHLYGLNDETAPGTGTLKATLQKMIAVLAVANRGCLILPRTWRRFSGLLTPPPGSPEAEVCRRNERLAAPLNKTPENVRSAYLDLYDALDEVGLDVDIVALTEQCLGLVTDVEKLVPAMLDWASTRYRAGVSRIYLAAKIIARMQELGHDSDNIILRCLSDCREVTRETEDHLHRVVIELVRLHAFSVGRYLQWLISSGALYGTKRTPAVRLIAALPMQGLSKRVLSTRNMLMGRLGYADDEAEKATAMMDAVAEGRAEVMPQMTRSTAYGLARQLVEQADSGLGLGSFCILRDVMERIGDVSSLADLISAACSSDNPLLLATATDTVSFHASSFAALGKLNPLADRLTEQYLALRPHQPLDRSFILALSGLVSHIQDKASMVKLLTDDLILCEQQTSLAACSPASDSVIDMHATNLDSDEDIDAVFASGNVMDEQLMQRVFMRIVQRASRTTVPGGLNRVRGWLEQLRSVDGSGTLKDIVNSHLGTMMDDMKAFSIEAIACLSLSGCASLDAIAEMAKDVKDPRIAAQVLTPLVALAEDLGLDYVGAYRFRLQQKRCQGEHTEDLMKLLRTAVGSRGFDGSNADVARLVLRSADSAVDALFAGCATDEISRKNAVRLLSTILGQETGETLDESTVIASATPLSVRFSTAVKCLGQAKASNSAATKDAILQAFQDRSEVWPQLLTVADGETMQALRERAQDVLLHLTAIDGRGEHDNQARRTLDLLALASNTCPKPDIAFLGAIADRLREVHRQLSARPDTTRREELVCKLVLILELATMGIHAIGHDADAVHQALTTLLQVLCALLVHPDLQLCRAVTEHMLDLASAFSDGVTEAALASLKTKLPSDPRLTSILGGSFNSASAWLALATQVSGPATAAGVGMTQQQRALNKHPSQQPQQQRRPGAPSPGAAPRGWPMMGAHKGAGEVVTREWKLRQWEVISDPAATVGENDTAVSLGLFGMRKV